MPSRSGGRWRRKVKEVIEKLLSVQEMDEQILRIKATLAEGPRRLEEENGELSVHLERYEELSRQAKEAMRAGERKNGDLEGIDRKIKDLNGKQMTARSNKEYEALKMEIAGHKADYEILEEEALQQWSVGEEREKQAAEEQAIISRLEAEYAERKAEWETEAKAFETEMARLAEIRAERAKDISPTWIETYEKVLRKCGSPALVEIVARYCQGCQRHVTVHDVTRAIKGTEVVQCKACSRILYALTL
jgi:predicted  nucleic acid-binding Zn-ribbon protein